MTLEEQLAASIALATQQRKQPKENYMDKVQFETNVPQSLALKYASGKRVESRYNEYEVYYSTTDGRALYASPALDQKIVEFQPEAGVPFQICKREVKEGQRKRIEWQVLPAAANAAPAPAPAAVSTRQPASEAPAAAQQTTQNHNAPNGSTSPQSSALPMQATLTQLMSGALVASIDSLAAAREYGKTKGFNLDFNEEDVRTVGNAIFIQYFRDAENRSRQQYYDRQRAAASESRVNGRTSWQQ